MENIVFDLQLFSDEEAMVEVEADETKEETAGEPGAETPKEEPPAIPEELDGLDLTGEEVKDILKEANVPEPAADADSDNKQATQDDDADKPQQNIPYSRFMEVYAKQHAAEEENAALRKQIAEMQAQKAVPPVRPAPQAQPAPTMQPTFTPEIAKRIDEAANQQAMQMTGMTKEDVDGLEYADDSDAKAKSFRYAKDLARASIIGNIQEAARRQQEHAARILAEHQKLVNEYNQFYQEQTAQPDFQSVVQFATSDFFEKQDSGVQFAVADAYNRVQRNTASPDD